MNYFSCPHGWRQLKTNEKIELGDVFYSGEKWFPTSITSGYLVARNMTYLRATMELPSSLDYFDPIKKPQTTDIRARIKKYIKKTSKN